MHTVKFLAAIALCLTATVVQAAGFRFIEVPADADGPALTGAMWYPCSKPPGAIDLGGIIVSGVKDCPLSGDRLPLVVVSHGSGASFVSHHDLAETLADAGFFVAAINHPADTGEDHSRSGDLSVLVERPYDIERLLDFMVGRSPAAAKIDPQRIGFFGHSSGGYTGLVLLGADPDWASLFCQRSSAAAICGEIVRRDFRVAPLAHDPRIRAAVIADPPGFLFSAGSLAAVRAPIQLWASERGTEGVTPESVAAVDRNLPTKHEYHVVPNSGHNAFLTPCTPAFATERLGLCADPPGFDRAAFLKQFDAEVLRFFRAHLVNP
jgi:predicted dienelactone hydrolase